MIEFQSPILTPVPDLALVGRRVALSKYSGVVARLKGPYVHKPDIDSIEHFLPWFK